MYAETGLMFPYFQSFSPDVQQFDDFCHPQKSNACLGSMVQTSTVSDYDLGGEGDLFKAPEPIIEQPLVTFDPVIAAMSMISCGEDTISPQELSVMDIEKLQSEELLSDVFYECNEILAKEAATETSPLSEVLNYKSPIRTDDNPFLKEYVHPPGQIPKSVSSDSLNSVEWNQGAQIKPSFVNIAEVDFGNAYGMRRAFSEGDIKTLANLSLVNPPPGQTQLISDHTIEERWQKLSRYRSKKTKRNFCRKIKYACRKALADSQPRIKGRFAKTEETEILRK